MKITIQTHQAHITPDTTGIFTFNYTEKIHESIRNTPWGERVVIEIIAPLTDEGIPFFIRHCDVFQTWLKVKLGKKTETYIFAKYKYINSEVFLLELIK